MAIAVASSANIESNVENQSQVVDYAEFPALMLDAKFDEMTGSALIDRVGNFITPDNQLGIVTNGAGNAWSNKNGFTTSNAAGDEVYARNLFPDVMPPALLPIGNKSVMFELDIDFTGGDHTGSFIDIGNADSTTQHGIRIGWNNADHFQIRAAGAAGATTPQNLSSLNGMSAKGRTHYLLVWNRNAASIGFWNIYENGIIVAELTPGVRDFVFSADPGSLAIDATRTTSIGVDNSTYDRQLNCTYYNARIWYVTTVPSNIATIALELAHNPEVLPASAKLL